MRKHCSHPYFPRLMLTIAVAGARADAHAGARRTVELHHVRAQEISIYSEISTNIYVLGNICKCRYSEISASSPFQNREKKIHGYPGSLQERVSFAILHIDRSLLIFSFLSTPLNRNVCTHSYSLVWYDWPQWEAFIDWMALSGVNMALAMTGQEEVQYKVFAQLGLSGTQRSVGSPLVHRWFHRRCEFSVQSARTHKHSIVTKHSIFHHHQKKRQK